MECQCLVLCDPRQPSATARAISAARTIQGLRSLALLAPEGLFDAASAPCDVQTAALPCFATPEAASALLGAVLAGSSRYTHVLAPMTPFGRAVLPRAAAAACSPCLTDVVRFAAPLRIQRHAAAGHTLETIEVTGVSPRSPVFAAIKTVLFDLPAPSKAKHTVSKAAAAEKVAKDALDGLYGPPCKPASSSSNNNNATQLSTAKRIVAGGLGMQNKEGFAKLYPLAKALDAGLLSPQSPHEPTATTISSSSNTRAGKQTAVAGSRSAVESGFCTEQQQVGQTGQTVAPELYVAVGISGAVQHTAGMREARTVVVVNSDAQAPFFGECDYGLVAPAESAVPELQALLSKGR